MLLVVLATCVCTIHAIAVSYYSSNFDINSNAILFVAELLKACVAMIGAYLIYNKSFPPLRLGFLVNSCLYGFVNMLTYAILSRVSAGFHELVLQHKLLWVIALSTLILKRKFSWRHYLACFLVLCGCVLVNTEQQRSSADTSISEALTSPQQLLGVALIVLQGFISSLSSVWIEKMMKIENRTLPDLSPFQNKLYWYLTDAAQMYLFGLPLYGLSALLTTRAHNLPFRYCLLMVATWTIQGLLLGAIFVYHSTIVRSFVGSAVIICILIATSTISPTVIVSAVLVTIGISFWSPLGENIENWLREEEVIVYSTAGKV